MQFNFMCMLSYIIPSLFCIQDFLTVYLTGQFKKIPILIYNYSASNYLSLVFHTKLTTLYQDLDLQQVLTQMSQYDTEIFDLKQPKNKKCLLQSGIVVDLTLMVGYRLILT